MEIPSFDEILASERNRLSQENAMQHEINQQQQHANKESQAQKIEAQKIISVMVEEKDLVLRALRNTAADIKIEYFIKHIPNMGGGRAKYGYALGWYLKRFVRKGYTYHDGESIYPDGEYIDKSEGLALTTDGNLHFTEDTGRKSGYWINKYPLHISKQKLIFQDSTDLVVGGNQSIINVNDVRSGLAHIKLQKGI